MRKVMLTLATVLMFMAFTLAGCETTKTPARSSGTTTTTTKTTPPTTTQKAPATTTPQAPATK